MRDIPATAQRIQHHRESWLALSRLLEQNDLIGLWQQYARYLEQQEIVSQQRMVLYQAAVRTAKVLFTLAGQANERPNEQQP